MTSLAFYASPIDEESINNEPIDHKKMSRTHNKTIKRYPDPSSKVENMRKQLTFQGIDTSQSNLGEFNPPDMPQSAGIERTREKEEQDTSSNTTDAPVNIESFNTLPYTSEEPYVPYYDKQSDTVNRSDLIHKLDYMIYLLEQQKEQKTDSATEEIILYSFLGIFIIFVLDSFARAGKYTR